MSGPHGVWQFKNDTKVLNLLSYSTPASYFDLNSPDTNLVIACPNPPAEAVKAGKAIPVPYGKFDAGLILERLPPGFKPQMVHTSARDLWFRPLNLHKLQCPVVMKLGDSFQWSDGSLSKMVEYCLAVGADFHWSYQCPHHLHFFVEAGLSNVFWMPGSIALELYVPARPERYDYDIIFRGNLHGVHINRARSLEVLQNHGFQVNIARKSYKECLDDYARARVCFNGSANGDSNRRVFEILMAGGTLLTDRISRHSGLYTLFEEGKHFECYGDDEELTRKATHLLQNPAYAQSLASEGQKRLFSEYHPEKMKQVFQQTVLSGKIDPRFRADQDKRSRSVAAPQEASDLRERMKIYEVVQELHAINRGLRLLYFKGRKTALLTDIADLPRLEISNQTETGARYDIILVDEAEHAHLDQALPFLAAGGVFIALGKKPPTTPAGLQQIHLVDSILGAPLGKGVCHIYRDQHTQSDLHLNLMTIPKSLRYSFSRLKARLKQLREALNS